MVGGAGLTAADAPRFGTSGLRGRVRDLSSDLVARHVAAFLRTGPHGGAVLVGRDLRPSSPALAEAVAEAVRRAGVDAVACGAVPTPALALAARGAGASAIMVTGSHLPEDRNGLKFYRPGGEIDKADERRIADAAASPPAAAARRGGRSVRGDVGAAWRDRIATAFGPRALGGRRVGLWEQSSVARDLLAEALAAMGAEVERVGRADGFVALDTEAVDAATRARIRGWVVERGLDAVVSTDADADRPLVADASGALVPGDALGVLAARAVGATAVAVPVTANDGIAATGLSVRRTRVGSPHVLAAMAEARRTDPDARIAGFEANGGFVMGFDGAGPAGPLPALPTRDSLLPIAAALAAGPDLAAAVAGLGMRATAADRIAGIDRPTAQAMIERLSRSAAARTALLPEIGAERAVDRTDGLRVRGEAGRVAHLRLSGNAPEMRVYVQATRRAEAEALLAALRARVAALLGV